MAEACNTTFQVFTGVGPDNSLERLTERSVRLIAHRPSNVYELLVALFEQMDRFLHPPFGYVFQRCLTE